MVGHVLRQGRVPQATSDTDQHVINQRALVRATRSMTDQQQQGVLLQFVALHNRLTCKPSARQHQDCAAERIPHRLSLMSKGNDIALAHTKYENGCLHALVRVLRCPKIRSEEPEPGYHATEVFLQCESTPVDPHLPFAGQSAAWDQQGTSTQGSGAMLSKASLKNTCMSSVSPYKSITNAADLRRA